MKLLYIFGLILTSYNDYNFECTFKNIDDIFSGSCNIFLKEKAEIKKCIVNEKTEIYPYKGKYIIVDEDGICKDIGLGWH